MDKAVIRGTFSDYKLIKTRKVVQIIVEVPVEQQAQVFAALGFPMPDSETWVAVARLDPEAATPAPEAPEKDKVPFRDRKLSWQAGVRCGDMRFLEFLEGRFGDFTGDPAEFVRTHCAVTSRKELDTVFGAGQAWEALNAKFERWAGLTAEAR